MNISASIYRGDGKGELRWVADGVCTAYYPDQKPSAIVPEHVTLSLGDMRIHLDAKSFESFCKQFLYNKVGDKNGISLLR